MSKIRLRAMRLDVKNARAAMSAVKPVKSSIGQWQRRLVYLAALVDRRGPTGESVDDLVAEAKGISLKIEESEKFLKRLTSELPLSVSSHSRFQDIVRALATAARAAGGLDG